MSVFSKLANILFDYDPDDDIPVITKEGSKEEETREVIKEEPKRREKHYESTIKNETTQNDQEVVVTKLPTPPAKSADEMPKFKTVEETAPIKKESTFTFPIIDDEEDLPKKETRSTKRRTFNENKSSQKKFDFLSSTNYKAKSDAYTASRNNIYEKGESKKPFTLSPIISPVYGILNENYKKEDIITKDSSQSRNRDNTIDLDSVRRKAYGTLEEEIEVSLNKNEEEDILDEVPEKESVSLNTLRDDGLSIHDLLVDNEVTDEDDIENEEEVFDINMEDKKTNKPIKKDEKEQEKVGEEDLFDLIDSIYAGKEDDK